MVQAQGPKHVGGAADHPVVDPPAEPDGAIGGHPKCGTARIEMLHVRELVGQHPLTLRGRKRVEQPRRYGHDRARQRGQRPGIQVVAGVQVDRGRPHVEAFGQGARLGDQRMVVGQALRPAGGHEHVHHRTRGQAGVENERDEQNAHRHDKGERRKGHKGRRGTDTGGEKVDAGQEQPHAPGRSEQGEHARPPPCHQRQHGRQDPYGREHGDSVAEGAAAKKAEKRPAGAVYVEFAQQF